MFIVQGNGATGVTGAGPFDQGGAPATPPSIVQPMPNPPNVDLRALEETVNRMLGNDDAMKKMIDKIKTPDNAAFSNDREAIVRDVRKVERDLHEFTHASLAPTHGGAIRG